MISTGICCTKSEVQLVPFESRKFVVQDLPNGNIEVKPDFLLAHFELLIKALSLELQVKALEDLIKKMKGK